MSCPLTAIELAPHYLTAELPQNCMLWSAWLRLYFPTFFRFVSAAPTRAAAHRLREKWPNAILIHTPIHASCLNQIEIYFSIVQRKVLTPNDFSSVAELEQRLLAFQSHYEQTASPFKWTFTRRDLHTLPAKIAAKRLARAA